MNRMTRYTRIETAQPDTRYEYRADGMRVRKLVTIDDMGAMRAGASAMSAMPPGPGFGVGTTEVRYRYDGQMPIEEHRVEPSGSNLVTRYLPGARGIDRIEAPNGGLFYPVYCGHGDQTGLVSRLSSFSATKGWFDLTNRRSYTAWGQVRTGATYGEPNPRHCANLGHLQDDESDLIYMRARYYEPSVGRFISQDPAMDGANWYVYCANDPIGKLDPSGESAEWVVETIRLLRAIGFRGALDLAWKQGCRAVSQQLRRMAFNLIGRGYTLALTAKTIQESGQGNDYAALVAGVMGRKAALDIKLGLEMLSIANFIWATSEFSDDFFYWL